MDGQSFPADQGARVVEDLIRVIQEHRQHLSDIDGAIGDGDHGVNMSKGFTLAAGELAGGPRDLAHSLRTVSNTLMGSIGGAMGPLYGMLFRGLGKGCEGAERIDAAMFGRMLEAAEADLRKVSRAQVGDKTLIDALIPAARAYARTLKEQKSFAECLEAMARGAEQGRDSTKDLVARVGRASRLGERSRGTLDAGAASCALLLRTLADSIGSRLEAPPPRGAGDSSSGLPSQGPSAEEG